MKPLKHFWQLVTTPGLGEDISSYQRRLILVFNQLNFIALVLSTVRLLYIMAQAGQPYTTPVILVNALPIPLCLFFMFCMHTRMFRVAVGASFIVVPPVFTLMAYFTGDAGLDIVLVLYCVFAFVFLRKTGETVVAFLFAAACFYVVRYYEGPYTTSTKDMPLHIFNYASTFLMLFITLYSVRHQFTSFGQEIRQQKEQLQQLNTAIMEQKNELFTQAQLMQRKNTQLTSMDNMRHKLISILSHDLRTPIYGLRNIFRNFKNLSHDREKTFENLLPQINHELDHTTELMENLLTWSRHQIADVKVNPTPLDLRQLTHEVFVFLKNNAAEKSIELFNNVEQPLFAYADKEMVKTVLRNLVSNAIKFTPEGGSIKVHTEPSDRFVNIVVEDNGLGIEPDKQATLFSDDFHSTPGTNNEQGSGLGLVICKDLVERNGGDIFFTGVPGGYGAIFTFSIPYNRQYVQPKLI